MGESTPPVAPHSYQLRPLLWRLPLLVLLAVGLTGLIYLDGLLQRDYRNQARVQAVQADALLKSFMRHRIALLHSLQLLATDGGSPKLATSRFPGYARELTAGAPDLRFVLIIDTLGVVRDYFPHKPELRDLVMTSPIAITPQVRKGSTTVATAVTKLVTGQPGLMLFDPIRRGATVVGYAVTGIAHRSLFTDALSGQLQGQFAYRVREETGALLARSPAFPSQIAETVERVIELPGGQRWHMDVVIPPFEPKNARAITWTVGLLLLILVTLLVTREEARAERLALHSYNLEQLSRNLLDANVRLEERAQQVTEANRAKSRFLANVSHELRTPLNAIVGYNSLALEGIYGPVPRPLRTAQERIAAAADHLLGLVDDVLDLAKIEVGRMEAVVESLDVEERLDSVRTVIEPIAEAKGVRVDVIVGRDVPQIVSDPRHVRQILLNLTANAIKFTEKGSVALIARLSGRDVCLIVEDTGIGIAEADRDRIFEEFEQVRPSARGDSLQRGTGLGLAISRKFARLLGGEITVESQVGVGSRFTVRLPIDVREFGGSGETPFGTRRSRTPRAQSIVVPVSTPDTADGSLQT
jgi:signal transduction histidine kinase